MLADFVERAGGALAYEFLDALRHLRPPHAAPPQRAHRARATQVHHAVVRCLQQDLLRALRHDVLNHLAVVALANVVERAVAALHEVLHAALEPGHRPRLLDCRYCCQLERHPAPRARQVGTHCTLVLVLPPPPQLLLLRLAERVALLLLAQLRGDSPWQPAGKQSLEEGGWLIGVWV